MQMHLLYWLYGKGCENPEGFAKETSSLLYSPDAPIAWLSICGSKRGTTESPFSPVDELES